MATGDIFQLKLNQNVAGRQENLMNVFYFRQTSSVGTASSVIKAFEDTWQPTILAMQNEAIRHSSIEVVNLFTVDDFAVQTYAPNEKSGTSIGDMLPIHDAVTFRLVRTSRDIRNGYKRFSGLSEPVQQGGVITNPDFIVILNAMASAMEGSIEYDEDSSTFEHIVLKRVRSGAGTPEDPYKYRLPLTSAEAVYSNPSSVLVNLFVRHQVSRGN